MSAVFAEMSRIVREWAMIARCMTATAIHQFLKFVHQILLKRQKVIWQSGFDRVAYSWMTVQRLQSKKRPLPSHENTDLF